MRLIYLPVNMAWVFTVGNDVRTAQIIRMGDGEMFHATRRDAVAAARRQGLNVTRAGVVSTDGPNPFESKGCK